MTVAAAKPGWTRQLPQSSRVSLSLNPGYDTAVPPRYFGGAGNVAYGGFGSLSGGTHAGACWPAGPRCRMYR